MLILMIFHIFLNLDFLHSKKKKHAHIYIEEENEEEKDTLFSTQDKEILSILEELEETADVSAISKTRLSGYFCSDTFFN